MDTSRILLSSTVVLLVLWSSAVTLGTKYDTQFHRAYKNHTQPRGIVAKRTYGSYVDALSIVIGIAGFIMSVTCTETGECSPGVISQRIQDLSTSVDRIENQIKNLQKEVEEIRQDTYLKWYLHLIDYVTSQMTKAADETLKNSENTQDVAFRQAFIDQNLGISRDDYVYKALFRVPKLITDDKLVDTYLEHQRDLRGVNEAEAVQNTCSFAKAILDYQDNGYASLILAYSFAFEGDETAYNKALAETCALWKTPNSPDYTRKCETVANKPDITDRRKPQKDHILGVNGLEGCALDNPPLATNPVPGPTG